MVGRELLDARVDGVGDEQPAGRVDRQPARPGQRAGLARGGADRAQEVAFGVEHLDAVVGGVGDEGFAGGVGGEPARERELARFGAEAAPFGEVAELRD